jgi:RNA polymerase sigma-70 factor (ECF subfamily)
MPLSDEARRIVDDARAAYGPSDEDRARVAASLPLIAAAAGAAAAASAGSSAAAASAGFFAAKGVALGLAMVVVVGGASVGYWRGYGRGHWRSTAESRPRAPSVGRAASAPAARRTDQPDPATSPPSAAPEEAGTPREAPSRGNRSRPALAPRAVGAQASRSEPGPDVAGEITLLGEAQRALANGQAERALQLLDRHAREFPRGSLTEERAAARIIALCALGRVEAARVETAAFVRQSPGSPLVDRVRAACGK